MTERPLDRPLDLAVCPNGHMHAGLRIVSKLMLMGDPTCTDCGGALRDATDAEWARARAQGIETRTRDHSELADEWPAG